MRKLSGIDADMIYGETPSLHMSVSALTVLDPTTAPEGFGFEDVRQLVAEQVASLPPLRERLLEVPFGIDRPYWVEDPDFDLDRHLHRVAVPAPGGRRELATLVGDLGSYKIDRSGPLWELWFIEGLESARVGMLLKVHHACADGVAGALMLGHLFRSERSRVPTPMGQAVEPSRPEPLPTGLELALRGLGARALMPLEAIRKLGRTAGSIRNLVRLRRSEGWDAPALPFTAPRTSFNRDVTPHRAVAFCSVPLDEVRRVERSIGVSLNDVVLALCAGALRGYLEARNELPDTPLIAAVPVSTRSQEQLGSFGNAVSGMFTSLATHLADPHERLRRIAEGTRSAKALYASGVEDSLMDWASLPSPAFVALAVRLFASMHLSERVPPIFNLLVSNVPGPTHPLYAGGARLVDCYPLGPLVDQVGLNVTVLSYTDEVGFGFMTCPELVPDPWAIADRIGPALEELAG
jgi:WS/DGAT/MGAT family acyltransferase